MQIRRGRLAISWIVVISIGAATGVGAQPRRPATDDRLGRTTSLEASYIGAFGNAETETLGFGTQLRYRWLTSRYSFRVDALRSKSADRPYVRVEPFPEGTVDFGPYIVLVFPSKTVSVGQYLVETSYDREVSEHAFWHAGFAWDRNKKAGILDRYVGFAGFGNSWWDRETLRWETTYGASYTNRRERLPDPLKDATFPGLRLASSFSMGVGAITTVENEWTSNANVADLHDWNVDTTTSLRVELGSHIALRASVRWLYNSLAALQEIDVRTILEGGVEIDFGDVAFRKERLDTIVMTSVVFTF